MNGPKKAPIVHTKAVAEQVDDDEGHDDYHDANYDPVCEEDDNFDYSTLKEQNVSEDEDDYVRSGSSDSDDSLY